MWILKYSLVKESFEAIKLLRIDENSYAKKRPAYPQTLFNSMRKPQQI